MNPYVPMPYSAEYPSLGPVRQKMCRIIFYIIQKYVDNQTSSAEFLSSPDLVTTAWQRLNADSEFCEQLELTLPEPTPTVRSNDGQVGIALFGGPSVDSQTYLTKEALQKAVESLKAKEIAQDYAKDYANYEDFLNYEI